MRKILTPNKPKKSYRIIIQQRKPELKMTSFMIYDFVGDTDIKYIKNLLETWVK